MANTPGFIPTPTGGKRFVVADAASAFPTVSPVADGDIGYAKDTNAFYVFDGTAWTIMPAHYYVSKSGNYTATASDNMIVVTAACTITLPTASGITGMEYIVKATADNVTVDGNGSETIDGEANKVLMNGDTMQIRSDGTNWRIV